MNINKNIRIKRKLVGKIRWYTNKITCMSTTNYRRLQYLVPSQIETLSFDQGDIPSKLPRR